MAGWGNTFNLGDTLQTIALLEAAKSRQDYLGQASQLAAEEAERKRLENDQARQAKLFAARKMMAGDIVRRAQMSGDPQAAIAQMIPAYQTVYGQLSGGDEWAPSIDEIMAYGGPDEAVAKAREAAMVEQARLGVQDQFGETPNAQYRLREQEARRGSLPQGYRFAEGGAAERIPGLPAPSTPDQELQAKLAFEAQQHQYRIAEKQAPTYSDLNPQAVQKPLTEGQEKSRMFSEMGQQGFRAMREIMDSGYDPTSVIRGNIDRMAAGTGPMNALASGPGQQWKAAVNNVVSSLLYRKSGAQAPASEIEAQSAIYAPAPGDDPETVQRKLRFIEDALSTIEGGVPGGAGGQSPMRGLPPGARELPDGTIIGPDGRRYRRAM